VSSIPLPALDIKTQQPDPVENYARMSDLLQRRQLQQQQLQAGQQENQARQMDLDSQRALQKAYMEANGDPDKTTELAARYGAKPQALMQWQTSVLDQKMKTFDLVSKQGEQAKIQADLMQGAHDAVAQAPAEQRPMAYQQQLMGLKQRGIDISQLPPQYPGDQAFALIGATVKTHTQMVDEALKSSEVAKNTAQAGKDTAESGKIAAEMPGGTMYSPSDNQLYGLSTNPNTKDTPQGRQAAAMLTQKQQEKLQLTGAEAGARMAAENSPQAIAGAVNKKKALDAATGAGEQVYATNQSGQTVLMAKGDAIAAGFGYTRVGAHQISEDRQLNNRLADVRQKIAQYESSFQQPLASNGWFSQSDKHLIAQVLGDDKFHLGISHTELPVDWMNKLGRSSLYSSMSPQARQRMIAYFNAREAIQGYQRVLTGSGRSSEKAMELNLDTLPAPIDPESYAGNALKAFKQNVVVAGQGMPILPGVKTPDEIEQQVNTR
jgi:hypothetical protein